MRDFRMALMALAAASCLAVAPVKAEPALWVVADSDTTLYLFGTIHTLRPQDEWRSSRLDLALAEATELIVEVAKADDEAFMVGVIQQHGVDLSTPLNTKLPEACAQQLDAAVEEYGANAPGIQALQPWVAAMTLGQLRFGRAGYDVQLGVDFALMQWASERNVAVSGLETAESQIMRFAGLSQSLQTEFLCNTLEGLPELADKLDLVRAAWLEGDMEAIDSRLSGGLKMEHPELYQAIFVERNRLMADRLAERLQQPGVVFVAVGAGHLAGGESILAELSARGINAVRR